MTPDTTPEAVYLIRKHGGYYRPNSRGYTTSAIVAGRYTQEQAESETHPNGPDGPSDGMTYIHENDVQGDEGWDAYRAQAARIAELEAENAILRTEKHADAEAITTARNNALREAALVVKRKPMRLSGQLEESVRQTMADAILSLIEGDKP